MIKPFAMVKSLAIVGTSSILLGSVLSPAFAADTGNSQYQADLQMRCQTLMDQFDALKTTNAKALALRKTGGDECNSGQLAGGADDGVKDLKSALKMVGVKPSEM